LIALLDTSVLWPSLQRDFLLSLAIEGVYQPAWSAAILDELQYHETAKLVGRGCSPREAAERAEHLVHQMRAAFDQAEVTVTANLRDFPSRLLPTVLQVNVLALRSSSLLEAVDL